MLTATTTIIQSKKHPWTLQLNLDTILLLCSSSQLKWKWKLHLTICDSLDYTVHEILQVRILEWVAVPFSNPGIFPTQGSNPGLPHCRQIIYRLSHQENPSQVNFWPNEWNMFLSIAFCYLTTSHSLFNPL